MLIFSLQADKRSMIIPDNLSIEGFANRLEQCVQESGLSPTEIGRKTGLRNTVLYKLCNRNNAYGVINPSSDTFLRLCAFFEKSPYWLLFGENFDFEKNISKSEIEKTEKIIEVKDSELETLQKENQSLKESNEKLKKVVDALTRKIATLHEDSELLVTQL